EHICAAIGLTFNDVMLDHRGRVNDVALQSSSKEAHRLLAAPLDPSRALSRDEIGRPLNAAVEIAGAETLVDLGYPRSASSLDRFIVRALMTAVPRVRAIRRTRST